MCSASRWYAAPGPVSSQTDGRDRLAKGLGEVAGEAVAVVGLAAVDEHQASATAPGEPRGESLAALLLGRPGRRAPGAPGRSTARRGAGRRRALISSQAASRRLPQRHQQPGGVLVVRPEPAATWRRWLPAPTPPPRAGTSSPAATAATVAATAVASAASAGRQLPAGPVRHPALDDDRAAQRAGGDVATAPRGGTPRWSRSSGNQRRPSARERVDDVDALRCTGEGRRPWPRRRWRRRCRRRRPPFHSAAQGWLREARRRGRAGPPGRGEVHPGVEAGRAPRNVSITAESGGERSRAPRGSPGEEVGAAGR